MRLQQTKTRKRKPYRHKQRGGFLSRYDFACAGRNTVNQLERITPGVVKMLVQKSAISLNNELTKQ